MTTLNKTIKSTLLKTALVATMGVSSLAFANELAGNWQTYEDGKPKAVVQIVDNGGVYTGKIISGNTDKAKQYVGKTVITGLRATGNGKYAGGSITDPTNNQTYNLTATLQGDTLYLKGGYKVFGKVIGRSQTWKKQ